MRKLYLSACLFMAAGLLLAGNLNSQVQQIIYGKDADTKAGLIDEPGKQVQRKIIYNTEPASQPGIRLPGEAAVQKIIYAKDLPAAPVLHNPGMIRKTVTAGDLLAEQLRRQAPVPGSGILIYDPQHPVRSDQDNLLVPDLASNCQQFTGSVSANTTPSCSFSSPGYTNNGSFTIAVTDAEGCAGTYTINAAPVSGSAPNGTTPRNTTIVTYIGFPAGNFLFANAGVGQYLVTITNTNGACSPTKNPITRVVTIADGPAGAGCSTPNPQQHTATANSINAPSCAFGTLQYQANGSFTINVANGSGCAGTYTVNASPVAGSGPGGTTPPLTTVVTYIGFPSGNFFFNNAGPGQYRVTINNTNGACSPPVNPVVVIVTVPDPPITGACNTPHPDQFTSTFTVVQPTCLYDNPGYRHNGSFTVSVANSSNPCAGTYTVNAAPVAGSGPNGTTPPLTTIVTYIGFPAGNFLFNNAGIGQYTITITNTNGTCTPPVNPVVYQVTVTETTTPAPGCTNLPDPLQFSVTPTVTAPSCAYASPGYAHNGSFLINVGDASGCAGTYTVNAVPVAGSGPGGVTPPNTTVVTYIGFPGGNFLFNNAGVGQYRVTVTNTGSCSPVKNPYVVLVTIPDGSSGGSCSTPNPAQFSSTPTITPPNCPFNNTGYTHSGRFIVNVVNGSGCTGTYTINATPVANSAPDGTTPPNTTVVTYIGFPAGNFTFNNAGVGQYRVTVTSTAGCNTAPKNPLVYTVTVPDAVPAQVNAVPNQTVCNGTATTAVNFSTTAIGSQFEWVNSNPLIGLGATGTGNIPSFTALNPGNTPVTATITVTPYYDNTGCLCRGTPVTFTITVNPTPDAVATPAAQTVCSGIPIATIALSGNVAGTVYNWTRDNTATVTGIAASGSGNIGGTLTNTTNATVTVTFTITPSANGCPGTPITATVTVNNAPTIICPSNITVNATSGQCGAIVNYPPATVTGAPAPTVTYSIASGSQFPVGTTTVTATATNTCGTVNCTFTVTVVDNQPPVITCPSNITVSNDPGQCGAVVNYALPSALDNCNRLQVPQTILAHGSGAITVAGNNAPGGFYFDLTNNSATARTISSLSVRFGSLAFGAVTSPTPVSVYVTTSATTYVGNQANAGAWTAVGTSIPVTVAGPNSEFSQVPLPGGGFTLAPGQSRGVYVFGVTQSLVYNNAANSNTTPVTNGVLTLTPGQASGGLFVAAATPRVPNVIVNYITLTQTAGLPRGALFPVGTTTNAWQATDDAGNSTSCSFTVTVNDTEAPTITCPANITVTSPVGSCTAVVNYSATTSDNCPGATVQVVSGPASGAAFPLGTTTVTLRARDAAGNFSAPCSFTVTVLDGQLPVISAQPANRAVCAGTNATFSVTATNAVSYQWQSWNGTAWVDISGATAATYTISNAAISQNNTSYRVRVIGLCTTVISSHATLVVNPNPTVSITPGIPPSLLPGQNLTLTAQPNPAGGGSYQWQLNGTNIAGATSQSLESITVDRTGLYRVIYTDANGCVGTSASLEVTAKQSGNLWVYPNPNQGVFNIRFFNRPGEEITVRVLDNSGREIHRQKTVTTGPYTNIQVNLNGQPVASETYVVEIRDSEGRQVGAKRIVVHR